MDFEGPPGQGIMLDTAREIMIKNDILAYSIGRSAGTGRLTLFVEYNGNHIGGRDIDYQYEMTSEHDLTKKMIELVEWFSQGSMDVLRGKKEGRA